MKKWLSIFIIPLIILVNALSANIIKTTEICDVAPEITADTLVLMNLAEVLLDTEISLGTQAWRKYIRNRVDSQTHDELTLFVFKNVPAKTPEPAVSAFVSNLQKQGNTVFGFTSRGRNEWYASKVEDVDLLTEYVLNQLDIDFNRTVSPAGWSQLDSQFQDYYHAGIIYATNAYDKGEMLTLIFEKTGYRPAKVVFVDDKVDSLKEVETSMKQLGIPFTGFAYGRTAKEHLQFDPMVANIQLYYLISSGVILSDKDAIRIKQELYSNVDPDQFLQQLVQQWLLTKVR